jgi:hypothetical protein
VKKQLENLKLRLHNRIRDVAYGCIHLNRVIHGMIIRFSGWWIRSSPASLVKGDFGQKPPAILHVTDQQLAN